MNSFTTRPNVWAIARLRSVWQPVVFFAALTVALTWPQAVRLSDVIPHRDTYFNMWRLAWVAHALAHNPRHIFDANIFAPERATLAYSDPMLVQGVLAAPMLWAGVSTPVVYNLLVLASFLFSALGAYALVHYLTDRRLAATIAGMVFAFTSYRYDHYMHLELLWSGWMPLAFLALQKASDTGRLRWGLATGLFVVLQTLSSIYYGIFLGVVIGCTALVLWTATPRAWSRRFITGVACGGFLALILLSPLRLPYTYARAAVGERTVGEVQLLSAGPWHYLASTPGNWIYGHVWNGVHEKRLFPGASAIGLMLVGLWPRIERRRLVYLAGFLVAVNLSFGANGLGYLFLRDHVDAFKALRVPSRAGEIALLMVAVLAGSGAARLESWQGWPSAARRRAVFSVLMAAMALEYAAVPLALVPGPTPLPVSLWLARQPAGIVCDLPLPTERTLPGHDPEYAYQSTFHWHALVNGYSGNLPPPYLGLIRQMTAFPSAEGLTALEQMHVRYVVVHARWYGADDYRSIVRFMASQPTVTPRGQFPDGAFDTAVFELHQ